MARSVDDQLVDIIRDAVIAAAVDLVELTTRKDGQGISVQLLVDKRGGVTMQECARLNREIRQLLEGVDSIPELMAVEVSSPGLDRPLKSQRDFDRHIGEFVDVRLVVPVDGQHTVSGEVIRVGDGAVTLRVTHGAEACIPLDDVEYAKRQVRFR